MENIMKLTGTTGCGYQNDISSNMRLGGPGLEQF